ncbi:MAG: hypothetical protein KME23_23635 [Goleter apudmare HA4340-LM2]|jgi:hypothetical protein|nr:hypothetical protein [Goleter apudmare HA4340-LM2]
MSNAQYPTDYTSVLADRILSIDADSLTKNQGLTLASLVIIKNLQWRERQITRLN